ncbi:MAG: SDR family NAD(P)-dependent oxidoreductase [Marinovum algicola]|jgi:NADP-dependent 3-hydroxy acid dehydrogenase YdfG|uniref:NADP-dependent 3-hydroxy acid dehydrogenase YdfG n=1 Tax=Marinovum algicola TaxID=42444 RepID=A0A975WFJ6_9RHOB|nr:SDR family NAD(P)-dependent oxidoreductase [Marinovum algicola]SEK11517.1 NADP-dependent 3-hydroxy acid dehydrogenase YdfG [Marinovum algicola]SLN76370.1 putative oxidoreductase [Marinovum algicola]
MTPDKGLTGRNILIAGATSGMGRATARDAARAGAGLVLLGRDRVRLDEVVHEASDLGAGSVLGIQADAADAPALSEALQGHAAALSDIDTLVNSVGVNIVDRAFVNLSADSWASMIATNLNAAFNLAKVMVPVFRARGGGLLINISSTAARKPDPSGAAYQATKAGVMAMTHAIMEEEWQHGIRATVILPGMTETPLLEKRPTPPTEEMRAKALQPEDIAEACMFVMCLPERAHVSELMIQPAKR